MQHNMIERRLILPVVIVLAMQSLILTDLPHFGNSSTAHAKLGRKGKYTESPAEMHYKEGKAKYDNDDLDGAIDALLQATYFSRNGYHPDAHYWLGMSYMAKGEDKKAVESLERCVSQSETQPIKAYLALAEIHMRNERWDECRGALDSIRNPEPKIRQQIHFLTALMYEKRAEVEKEESSKASYLSVAESHFEQAMGLKPWKWVKCWVMLCECKMKQKKWQDAIQELNALIHTDYGGSHFPIARVHKDIGLCRLAIGDHQGALDNWHRALDYDKRDAEVWLQVGMLLESERHYSSAAKNYKEFLRLMEDKPDNRIAHVRDRLTKIEHMLAPNETNPQRPGASQYMRMQTGERMKTEYDLGDQQRRQDEQEKQRKGDSGF